MRSAPREENSSQIGAGVDSLVEIVSAPNHACGVQKSEMDILGNSEEVMSKELSLQDSNRVLSRAMFTLWRQLWYCKEKKVVYKACMVDEVEVHLSHR